MKYREPSKLWACIFVMYALIDSVVLGLALLFIITAITLTLIGTMVVSMVVFWTVIERIVQWTT